MMFRVAPGSFQPPPKVESAVVRIEPRSDPAIDPAHEETFRRFVIDAFGMRRKQMRRVLRSLLHLDVERADAMLHTAGVDGDARPESLSAADFARLVKQTL